MNAINVWTEKLSGELTYAPRQEKVVTLFCKTLYFYFILKIIATWPLWSNFIQYYPPRIHPALIHTLVFFPARWAGTHLDTLCWFSIIFTGVILFTRVNYFTSLIIFWLALNFYKINYGAINGSDLVFLMLLGLTIPMGLWPRAEKPAGKLVQQSLFNAAVLLCKLQIVVLYVNSGFDKLMSPMWRSGEAFQYISRLDYLFFPRLMVDGFTNPVVNFILAWAVILFELSFPWLVWNSRTRRWTIVAGIVFHVFISVFLSLPDFGMIMIVSYLIFLKEEEVFKVER